MFSLIAVKSVTAFTSYWFHFLSRTQCVVNLLYLSLSFSLLTHCVFVCAGTRGRLQVLARIKKNIFENDRHFARQFLKNRNRLADQTTES